MRLLVLSLIYKQVKRAFNRASTWFSWVIRIFGLRFCLGFVLACLVLLAGWLPQIESSMAAFNDGSIAVQQPSSINANKLSIKSLASVQPSMNGSKLSSDSRPTSSYLEFDPAVAQRLNYSGLTQNVLTGSHLTRAHFFTNSVSSSSG